MATHTGAGGEDRTRAASLEGWNSTTELHPRTLCRLACTLFPHEAQHLPPLGQGKDFLNEK